MRSLTLALALAAMALAGCKDVGGPAAPEPPSSGEPSPGGSAGGAAPRAVTVEIEAFEFRGPGGSSAIVVAVGDTLVFVNRDAAPHTATSTSVPSGASTFDTGRLDLGESARVVVGTAGTYAFRCDFHPAMTGTVAAAPGSGPDGTPPPGGADPGGAPPPVGSPPSGTPPPGGTPPPATGEVLVEIRGDRFVGPDGSSAIVVQLGQSIRFVNRDDSDHTATSTATPAGGAAFDTGGLDTGASATVTPDVAGTWRFRCDFHPEMTGTITVTAAGTPPPAGGTPPGGTPSGGTGVVVLRITDAGFDAGGNATIALGQSIEWANESGDLHELESTDEPDRAADFRGELAPGARLRFTPDRTGTWVYRCKEHDDEEDMTITVR